tara:strand:- start:192 stop:347 length:156 start_codon:yes stop_codon:yes gene_type:complete
MDSDDEYRDEITYDSPLDQNCEILFLKNVLDSFLFFKKVYNKIKMIFIKLY